MTMLDERPQVVGKKEPRLWTRPRRRLTRRSSYGYAVIEFARDVLGEPLDPWEEWLVIHLGELLPDGRPRFRIALVLVARQNGKTHVLRVLGLFWQFVERHPLVLSMSTNLDYAREAWEAGVDVAEETPVLAEQIATVRRANGEQQMRSVYRSRWKIAASNRRGGRSLTVDRLVLDELREHHDWSAWNAAVNATNARPGAQIVAITNQGDETAVVLDSLRDSALDFIETGDGDDRLGLFEWSAPDGCEVDDVRAIAQANPNLGLRLDLDALLAAARRAKRKGGEEEAGFRTEVLCQRVRLLSAAIDPQSWRDCFEDGSLDDVRRRVALCLDVAPDGEHATLAAAAVLADGRVRVEIVKAWEDTAKARAALAAVLARVKAPVLGWFPAGPAAALAADLDARDTGAPSRQVIRAWVPKGTDVVPIRQDTTAVCMGFEDLVRSSGLVHADDPLLSAHVGGAERLRRGDGWVFSRRQGHVDAAYAAAGAVHLARTLKPSVGRPRLVVAAH